MTRDKVVKLAAKFGWKVWGKLRPYKNGSKYQCFRRGNNYVWIGNRFVESSIEPIAVDFILESAKEVRGLLHG